MLSTGMTVKSPTAIVGAGMAKMVQRPVTPMVSVGMGAKMPMKNVQCNVKENARAQVVVMAKSAAPEEPIVSPTEGEVRSCLWLQQSGDLLLCVWLVLLVLKMKIDE